jgi:ubiquinol-cytochrome c reductase cytochrome b subunit
MSGLTTPTSPAAGGGARPTGLLDAVDQRLHPAAGLRKQFNKVFPTHWSFMLGEIALYSFVVLLASGTYLAIFFDPSMAEVTYSGQFDNLRGLSMSRAFESALRISFDVRGGLLVRQVHHWAALLFLAAMVVHMFRAFFTGAFRNPRETNWIIGVVLILLGMFEGFSGYSLPDDLLSGTGLRIGSGITLSVPVVGTWLHWALFGAEFPGTEIIPRLYIVHVLLLPGLLLALIAVHVGLVWYQKHTQFPGPGRTERNVVGVRILPTFAAKGGAFLAVTVGVIVLMAGVFQIIPLIFGLAVAYPAIERRFTRDRAHHNLLQRPRDAIGTIQIATKSCQAMRIQVIGLHRGSHDVVLVEHPIRQSDAQSIQFGHILGDHAGGR